MLSLPTGAGKTSVAVDMLKKSVERGKRTAFVVDRLTLIDQTISHLEKSGLNHGVIQGNHERYNPDAAIQVCSIQTLVKRGLKDVDFVIIDEAHTMYKAHFDLFKKFNKIHFLGLSATPFTKGLGKHWERLVTGPSAQELIDLGFLVPFDVYGPGKPDLTGVRMTAGDYNQQDLAKASNKKEIVADIVTTWLKRVQDRPTLCFAVDIAHSKHICDEFRRYGIPAKHLDCYTDKEERSRVIQAHESGEIKVLTCCDLLVKGYDSPMVSCLIQARPTKSLIVHIQQLGRVLRIFDGKENAIILDHAGNHERLGFANDPLPAVMDMGEKKEKTATKKKEKLPRACPECTYMIPCNVYKCPQCGYSHKKENKVETKEGDLVKLKKGTITDKRKWYSMLLYHSQIKGYQEGWASHKYREIFKVWPNKKCGIMPVKPDKEVADYITHISMKARHQWRGK